MPPQDWTRRNILLYGSAGMAAAGLYPISPLSTPAFAEFKKAQSAKLNAVILGATDAGNYGHGLDRLFDGLDDVDVVAVSDANDKGRAKAQERLKVESAYADFREMLAEQKPDLAVVSPRWTNQHHAMTMASLEAGAHVYLEKPIARTLAEADEMIALADEKGLKIAVAHQMRCDPHILRLEQELRDESLIGKLIEIRVFGKMDKRVGGEDMLVLGTHLFDLVRFFAGDAVSVTSRIRKDDQPAKKEDAHESDKENIGPLLGNDIRAYFETESGTDVTFISQPGMGSVYGPWGMELTGTKGKVRIFANHPPTIALADLGTVTAADRSEKWTQWPDTSPYHEPIDELKGMQAANRRVVYDWLEAIREDREPQGSGLRALKSLEMIHAVWTAGLSGERVTFPLENREHPLA